MSQSKTYFLVQDLFPSPILQISYFLPRRQLRGGWKSNFVLEPSKIHKKCAHFETQVYVITHKTIAGGLQRTGWEGRRICRRWQHLAHRILKWRNLIFWWKSKSSLLPWPEATQSPKLNTMPQLEQRRRNVYAMSRHRLRALLWNIDLNWAY